MMLFVLLILSAATEYYGQGAYIRAVSEFRTAESEYLIHANARIKVIEEVTDEQGRTIVRGVLLQ